MIINDDILNWCKEYKGEKFHALLCDPPYHLTMDKRWANDTKPTPAMEGKVFERQTKGFMGKSWDGGDIAFRKETWEALKEHLYPGAFCFAFASTRGLHRMMCAIEDAGFVIHPTIFLYAFGCLSEDTEVLTKDGWERYHNNKNNINTSYNNVLNKEILIYDYKNDNYTWEVPKRIFNYKYKDTAYRITSNKTEQIVSRGHRCLVKREGKLLFVQAEKLFNMEYMPYLRNDFFEIFKFQKEIGKRILQPKLQWESEGIKFNKIFRQREREKTTGKRFKRRKKSCLERRLYLYEKKRSVCEPIDKIRKMPYKLHINGKERRLCYGTSLNSRKRDKTAFVKNRSSASHKSQCRRQQNRKFNVIQIEYRTQKIRTRASYNTTLATVTKIDYEGIMYCPTVSTGAFVARRNGKIFITGNSGFPKATRIDTQIQSKEEQEVVGKEIVGGIKRPPKATKSSNEYTDNRTNNFSSGYNVIDKIQPTDPLAKQWTSHRYGLQALKPSCEPIICFQNRYEGKPVNCIVETGAGALNIDGGRIPTNESLGRKQGCFIFQTNKTGITTNGNPQGRWPSNLIIDKECAERFPMTESGELKESNKINREIDNNGNYQSPNGIYGKYKAISKKSPSSSGSAARYFKNVEMKIDNADPVFYTSKVSKEERNKGCENKFVSTDIICYICNVDLINNTESNLLCDANIIQEAKKVKLSEVMEIFQKKDIEEFGTQAKSDIEWNTMLFMKNILELYQKDTKSTILTEINSITISQIYNWLINYFTQESIRGVNCEMTAGGNLVLNVKECYMNQIITEANKDGLLDNAKSAELKLLVEITKEEMQSKHPTLKPIDLTTYLATLLLPPIEYAPRRILVPFAGAGSEMIGCLKAGWEDIVGIELTEEYIPIIEARYEYYRKQIEFEKEQQIFTPEIMENMNNINKQTLFES